MSDIIERAEAALEDEKQHPQRPWAAQGHSWIAAVWRAMELIPELITALKAARADRASDYQQFKQIRGDLVAELEAARAEIIRLTPNEAGYAGRD